MFRNRAGHLRGNDGERRIMSHESGPRLLAGYRLPPRQPKPGELIWEFRHAAHHVLCELRGHGEPGWEAQISLDGDLLLARRFVLREEAMAWAESERQALEKGGE